ncbi:MAG: glycosyltransferase family 4 protein [Kiritimatiellae bacterium]|nr:glycosyltransferase family 4 protein [Kiritimatiellia bacterium]
MMLLLSIVKRVRLWGWKGVWDFFIRQLRDWRTKRFFLKNARKYPLTPESGVTILADITHRSSLSKVMRDFAYKLQEAGIPFQAFDIHSGHSMSDCDAESIITPPNQFRILKFDHVVEMFSSPMPKGLPLKRARIVFWEFTTGLLEYNPLIANAGTIIAMSDFNREVFRRMMPPSVEVRKIIYPFFFDTDLIADKRVTRRKYNIPQDAFVVFFNFDYGSSFNRKNPDGAIRAFAKAFANSSDSFLVFKTKGAHQYKKERNSLLLLASELRIGERFVMIDDYIPQHDIYGLTEACDVYLSLHRGEGLGLGIVEAMSLAKPVVATNYSATTEFCNKDNSIPVPCKVVRVPDNMHDHPCYHSVKEWAEPSIEAAAEALIRLYESPELCQSLGIAAQAFIRKSFSIENFRNSIEDFLLS